MNLEQFSALYDRIQTDPSILLLGQQYYSMGGEKNPVWQTLCTETYADLNLPRKQADYPTLWEASVSSDKDAVSVMEGIAKASQGCTPNEAIEAVLLPRWSLLYTSAIDCEHTLATAKGCSPVPYNEQHAKPQYLNKDRHYRVELCGNRETPPPANHRILSKRTVTKISWICDTYLEYYGVLVIDGLDPTCDWLDDDTLFGTLVEMPVDSIFWFGAPDELGECAAELVKKGIMTVETDSFYEHMIRHTPELLEAAADHDYNAKDAALYAPLTLKLGNQQTRCLYISRSDISDINGGNLCVIDDDVLSGRPSGSRSRAQRFAEFLSQNSIPNWYLFNTNSDELPFYIPRDADPQLEKKVYEALKDNSSSRKPIILSGPSNSGKSMMLANLALTIAKRRKHPVIFIRGDLLSDAGKRLDAFIDNWFCNAERLGGERLEKTVVIWDGSGLKRTAQDYETLQRLLFNRNVQVIGSAYSASGNNRVELAQDLSSKELGHLQKVLASLGSAYADRFTEVSRNWKKATAFQHGNLLYLLQAVFKYEFSEEYRQVSEILAHQFDQERRHVEQATGKSLEAYVENFFETQKKIVQRGVASSFQEKLRLLLVQHDIEQRENEAIGADEATQERERLKKLKRLSDCIEAMNGILALASEFGVQLPLHLLLHFLNARMNSAAGYTDELSKIITVLRNDTLINFEYKTTAQFGEEYYVSFRNPTEAENYICLMCELPLEDHSDTRKEKEIELLKSIIETASTDQELRSVIELVRQFGPNGHGMLSELETMRNKKDYTEYSAYWTDIADTLIEHFPDDPEAVLLYAHLTRESIALEEDEHKTYFKDLNNKVRTRLEGVLKLLEDDRRTDSPQYARLSVELCANYQQTMREDGYNSVIHREIKNRVREAFRRSKRQDSAELRRDFSSNYLLDILLNAFFTYADSKAAENGDKTELAQILTDIDDMLNLDDLTYEKKSDELLKKVNDVYGRLNNAVEHVAALQKKLSDMNSDAFLYLQARLLWQIDKTDLSTWESQGYKLPFSDYYSLLVGRDIPYNRTELPADLYEKAAAIAERAVNFLNEHDAVVRKTRSERCIAMRMRAEWFVRTGNAMLAEKQQVALTRSDWNELNAMCTRYDSYHDAALHEPFAPAYFLKAVYEWIYGNPVDARDWFAKAKTSVRNNQAISVDRLVLCAEGTSAPRTFRLSVKQNENRKYTASIVRETTTADNGADNVSTRYGMGVSEAVLKYLFDGTLPKEQQQQTKKDGIIRFNLIGAQIGIPALGGYDNDH